MTLPDQYHSDTFVIIFLHTATEFSLGSQSTWKWLESFKLLLFEINFHHERFQNKVSLVSIRVGVNSAPELDFLGNSKSNSGIGIELELALPSPGGIGIELELPSFELELESELRSSELNSELPSWN